MVLAVSAVSAVSAAWRHDSDKALEAAYRPVVIGDVEPCGELCEPIKRVCRAGFSSTVVTMPAPHTDLVARIPVTSKGWMPCRLSGSQVTLGWLNIHADTTDM
jgi:hypothetical protein